MMCNSPSSWQRPSSTSTSSSVTSTSSVQTSGSLTLRWRWKCQGQLNDLSLSAPSLITTYFRRTPYLFEEWTPYIAPIQNFKEKEPPWLGNSQFPQGRWISLIGGFKKNQEKPPNPPFLVPTSLVVVSFPWIFQVQAQMWPSTDAAAARTAKPPKLWSPHFCCFWPADLLPNPHCEPLSAFCFGPPAFLNSMHDSKHVVAWMQMDFRNVFNLL